MKLRWLWFAGAYIFISLLELLSVLIYAFPYRPGTSREWVLLFFLAFPIALLLSVVEWGLWRNPLARVLVSRTANNTFSWLRLVYALVAALLVLVATFYFSKALNLEKLFAGAWLY